MKNRKTTKTAKTKTTSNKFLKTVVWFLVAILVSFASIGLGYYLGYEDGLKYSDASSVNQKEKTTKEEKRVENLNVSSKKDEDIKDRLKTVLEEEQNKYAQEGPAHEHEESSEKLEEHPPAQLKPLPEQLKPIPPPVQLKPLPTPLKLPAEKLKPSPVVQVTKRENVRPKLAIIIDDVSFRKDVSEIKKLNLNLTMSFLPPTAVHPDSAVLASKELFYMVHLPMEAVNFRASEPLTLKVNDSEQFIMKRIGNVVSLFPRVKYLNNHTGSKFTSNEVAMNRLIFALNKYKIHFVDSRTTAETKVPKVMKAYGERYIARDVFLDDNINVEYIKKQIREAVKIAKIRGYAIAIGHPHEKTLEALHESKDLLSQVELVQVNKL